MKLSNDLNYIFAKNSKQKSIIKRFFQVPSFFQINGYKNLIWRSPHDAKIFSQEDSRSIYKLLSTKIKQARDNYFKGKLDERFHDYGEI